MSRFNVGDKCFYVHLEFAKYPCTIEKVIREDAYEISIINARRKKVILKAYDHELYTSKKEYEIHKCKEAIKCLKEQAEVYYEEYNKRMNKIVELTECLHYLENS